MRAQEAVSCFFWLLFFSTDRFHVRYGKISDAGQAFRVPDQHEPWDVAADGVREEIKSNVGPIGGHGRCGSAPPPEKKGRAAFCMGFASFYFLHVLGVMARAGRAPNRHWDPTGEPSSSAPGARVAIRRFAR